MSTIFALPDNIKSQFFVDSQGQARAFQRATTRLGGVSLEAIRKLLLKLSDNLDAPKILKSYAGYSFNGDNLPSQTLAQIGEKL